MSTYVGKGMFSCHYIRALDMSDIMIEGVGVVDTKSNGNNLMKGTQRKETPRRRHMQTDI